MFLETTHGAPRCWSASKAQIFWLRTAFLIARWSEGAVYKWCTLSAIFDDSAIHSIHRSLDRRTVARRPVACFLGLQGIRHSGDGICSSSEALGSGVLERVTWTVSGSSDSKGNRRRRRIKEGPLVESLLRLRCSCSSECVWVPIVPGFPNFALSRVVELIRLTLPGLVWPATEIWSLPRA